MPRTSTKTKSPSRSRTNNKKVKLKDKSNKSKILMVAAIFAVVGASLALFASAGTEKYFEPTVPLSRQAAAAFLYRTEGSPAPGADSKCGAGKTGPFADVAGDHTFCKEIEWMVKQGITKGYGDGTFKPTNPVSRAVMATFMYRTAGEPQVNLPATSPFNDVATDNAHYKAIVWMKNENITTGYGDGSFKPNENVSRQAAATFLHRQAGSPDPEVTNPVFLDVNKNHPFFKQIQWLGEQNISVGYVEPVPSQRPGGGGSTTSNNGGDDNSNTGDSGSTGTGSGGSGSSDDDTNDNQNGGSGSSDDTTTGQTPAPLYFNPNRETSRQAMVAFLYRAEGSPAPADDSKCKDGEMGPFKDVPSAHMFCKEIEWASTKGVTTGYPDDTFRPEYPVTRAAAAAFIYRLDGSTETGENCGEGKQGPYPDVAGDYTFCKEIDYMKSKGYLTGYEDGTFRPNESITRQAAAVMLWRRAGSPTVDSQASFGDVKADSSFAQAINWVSENGITTGDTKQRSRYLDPLTKQELGPGAQGEVVLNMQTRLRARGFGALVPLNSKYDGITARSVQYWQKLNGLPQTGIFNCGQTCNMEQVDTRTLIDNERTGKNFDISPLLRLIEAEERARNEREAAARAAAAAPAQVGWNTLENQYLCKGITDQPDMIGHLQWRFEYMGYGGMRAANGDYTRVYDNATAFNVNLWKQMHGWGTDPLGCFDSKVMLGQLKKDFDTNFRYDPGPLSAFLTPRPVDCNNPFNQWVNPDCKYAIPKPPAPAPSGGGQQGGGSAPVDPNAVAWLHAVAKQERERQIREGFSGWGAGGFGSGDNTTTTPRSKVISSCVIRWKIKEPANTVANFVNGWDKEITRVSYQLKNRADCEAEKGKPRYYNLRGIQQKTYPYEVKWDGNNI